MESPPESSKTGIKELDDVLSGGFPKGSVVLLSGSSGSGKTTLAFQWLFEGVKENENGIYITFTEPLFRALKNLEPMDFYSRDAIEDERLKILDAREIGEFGAEKMLKFIESEAKSCDAKRLVIDSITAIAYSIDDKAAIRRFIFELGKTLASVGCTTILTSEVSDEKIHSVYGVEEFISDAIVRLDQIRIAGELQRRLQVIKMRGKSYRSDEHFYKITKEGVRIFPRVRPLLRGSSDKRISVGNSALDSMTNGGVFQGSSTLITGPSGAGKSLSAMQFIAEGLKNGENCLYAGFEESREQIIRNARSFGWDFEQCEKDGILTIRSAYPGEMFIDEHFRDIMAIIEGKGIKRCAVDSLSAVSNSFPEEHFTQFSKRLVAYMKSKGVTSFLTSNIGALVGESRMEEGRFSILTDNIIVMRYAEMQGELRRILNVIKVNGSTHSKGLRTYDITSDGIVVGQSLSGFEGIMTGNARKVTETTEDTIDMEFRRYLGPMGASVFRDMKKRGINARNVSVYIDELEKEGILKKDDARKFRLAVLEIIGKRGEE